MTVDVWRRTFWFFYYDGRMRYAAAIPQGSLTKRHVGDRPWVDVSDRRLKEFP